MLVPYLNNSARFPVRQFHSSSTLSVEYFTGFVSWLSWGNIIQS